MDIQNLQRGNREQFISDNKSFIEIVIRKLYSKKIDKDLEIERNIGTLAFGIACNHYTNEKGDFFRYAEMLIKNSFFYYLQVNKEQYTVIFDTSEEEELGEKQFAIEQAEIEKEMETFIQEWSEFKMDINRVMKEQPKDLKDRNRALNYAFLCLKEKEIQSCIDRKKVPPAKYIAFLLKIDVKWLKRHFAYLWMLILLLYKDEYIYIRTFLNIKIEVV